MKTRRMETKFKSTLEAARHSFGRLVCFGALSLICSSASAQNLFVSDYVGGNIDELAPAGVRSTFASGVSGALAFDRAGNLFVSAGAIYKFTPAGVRSTFVSGISGALACDSAGNLFVAFGDSDNKEFPINGSGKIYKFTPDGVRTTFSFGLDDPSAVASHGAGDLFFAHVSTLKNDAVLSGAIY